MADQIRFYRASNGSSLPSIKDGAIFVVTSDLILSETNADQYYGDMYVDISNTERLHIRPSDGVYYWSQDEWNAATEKSDAGRPYFVIQEGVPSVGVGNGTTKIKDLSLYHLVTETQTSKWNSKDNAKAVQRSGDDYTLQITSG